MIDQEGVTRNFISPDVFLEIFSGVGEVVSQGQQKRDEFDRVTRILYNGLRGDQLQARITSDANLARSGIAIHHVGIGPKLFPHRYSENPPGDTSSGSSYGPAS